MPRYYLNNTPQETGEREVHEEGCYWLSLVRDRIDLGVHPSCIEAMVEARKHYYNVDGCKDCCPLCHTR